MSALFQSRSPQTEFTHFFLINLLWY